ncbi:MAG: EamA family transporter [Lachnospiraceae bacterium]|nr:EamA family transporter [Candidatus Merdinaster equi]
MKRVAPFFILLAGMLWGSMGVFVRTLNGAGLATMDIVTIRNIGTTILLGIFLLCYNRRLFRIKIKDIWCFLGTGLCSIVFFNYCYFKTITFTSLSVAAVLLYTAPAFVMVMSFFLFKEKLSKVKVAALIFTLVGCAMVTGIMSGEHSITALGILTGIGAGFGYALYSIFSRFALEKGYHIFTILFYTFGLAMFGSIPMSNVGGIVSYVTGSWFDAGFTLIFVLASTVIPYFLYTSGLRYVENGPASIIASVEPVVATLIGVVFMHETMSVFNIIGVVLVLGSIVMCNVTSIVNLSEADKM